MRNVWLIVPIVLLVVSAGIGANIRPVNVLVNDDYWPAAPGKAATHYPAPVGKFAAPPYPIDTVGGTTYDVQWNGSTMQTIYYDPSYGIHVAWMGSQILDTTARWSDRNMRYNFWDKTLRKWKFNNPDSFMASGVNSFGQRAGYGMLDVNPLNHCACLSTHVNNTPTTFHISIAEDSAPGSGVFDSAPGPNNYVWPGLAVTSVGSVHNAVIWDNSGTRTNLYYTKMAPWDTFTSPTDFPPPLPEPAYPTQTLVASKLSGKVVIAWEYYSGAPQPEYYRVSSDDGVTWQAETLSYPPAFSPGSDTSASFYLTGAYPFLDAHDNLHFVANMQPVVSGAGLSAPIEIWHWSQAAGWSRVARAQAEAPLPGNGLPANALYADRPTLGEANNGNLVCAWEQFDTSNEDRGDFYLRADVWSALSSDGGMSWSDPIRITTPDSTSKRYPSIAPYFPSDTFYVRYEVDLSAGEVVLGEGIPTYNPIIVERVPLSAMGPNRDVGTVRIIAPVDTLDSGQVVTPQAVVKNYGQTTETFPVDFRIGSIYTSTRTVDSLAPGDTSVVSFDAWTASRLGAHAVQCSTALSGDRNPANDAQVGGVTVGRVKIDVGTARILTPGINVDSGTAVTPQAVIENYGGRPESFTVSFKIGGSYLDTFVVTNLGSGDSTTISFRQWNAMPRGKSYARCSTELEGDENPANDVAAESVMVRVLDVGVSKIVAPIGHVDSGTVVTPKALVTNYGTGGVTFKAYLDIAGSPRESTAVTLAAGLTDTARFAAWTASIVGTHSVRCTTLLAGDMNPANNQALDSVVVVAVPVGISAVNGGPLPVKFAISPGQPNPFLGRTAVRYALPKACDVALRVFDATGAVVRSFYSPGARPGYYEFVWDGRDNRGRSVGSGLYFCCLQAGESRGMIKVVKTD